MNKVCSTCGGTGEVGFFQGVSRFLLSWDECPQCFGTGYIDEGMVDSETKEKKSRKRKSEAKKKKN